MRVSVVIPARDEEAAIGRVIDELPRELVSEVIVVDGGSTDRTREVAAARGARVILDPRRGYGRACLTGLEQIDAAADVVVFLDADYSDRPAELPRLLAPITEGRADLVLGSRLAGVRARGALPWHSVVGNRVAAALLGLVSDIRLTDLGPFRAARPAMLRALSLQEHTYGWPVEMLVKGSARGYRIVEVPVSYHPRIGTSKITGTVRGSMGAAWCIFSGIIKYRLQERARARRHVVEGTSADVAHRVLVVMAKAPRPGRVKTRLSGEYPVGAIVELYRCLLDDTLALGLSLQDTQVAVMAPPEDRDELAALLPAGVRCVAQQGIGLAAALTSVFAVFTLEQSRTPERSRRVIAFNSDSPHLPRRALDEAFAALLTHDLVVGPTGDGGYYLVGATAPHAGLFHPAPMGTGSALESLLANARASGLTYRLTQEWFDVDVAGDLTRLAEALRRDPSASPRTAALLRSWSDRPGTDVARGSGRAER